MQDAKRPLLSIFVSVYNLENYIEECLDSIFNSKSQNFELILIDDASCDSGPDICKEYAELYPYVQILSHSKQEGPAASRNEGIRHANGRYL